MEEPDWAHPLAKNPYLRPHTASVKYNEETKQWEAYDTTTGQVVSWGDTREKCAFYATCNNYNVEFAREEKYHSFKYGNIVIESKDIKKLIKAAEAQTGGAAWGAPRLITQIKKAIPGGRSVKVKGTQPGTQWITTVNNDGSCQCTCPAFRYGGTDANGYCKHIINLLSAYGVVTGYKHSFSAEEMLKSGMFMTKADYDKEVKHVFDMRARGELSEEEKIFQLRKLKEFTLV